MDSPIFRETITYPVPGVLKRRLSTKNEICSGCNVIIESDSLLEAMNQSWHFDCFKCSVCQLGLPDIYYEEDRLPYCKTHYYEKFACKCLRCRGYITGPAMSIGLSLLFHPECFYCLGCCSPLGEKDTFSLATNKDIFCNRCSIADKNINHDNSKQTQITIQMIKIILIKRVRFQLDVGVSLNSTSHKYSVPKLPLPQEQVPERQDVLKIRRIPKSLSETPIKIGDEILEINGVPIINQNQKEINGLMKIYNDIMYLTIRRRHTEKQYHSDLLTLDHSNNHSDNSRSIEEILLMDNNYNNSKSESDKTERLRIDDNNSQESFDKSQHISRCYSLPAIDPNLKYLRCFRLSDLDVGEVIGRGFYGNVTTVTHRETGQVMVMKEMLHCTERSKIVFRKEVQLLKTLNHPNILHFIGILYKEGKVLNLITEYIRGGTLRKRIKTTTVDFQWETRIRIAHDISSGMSYLHQRDIIHRDLKSKNCLLKEDMTAVVADFGLARVFQPLEQTDGGVLSAEYKKKTRMTVVGTPYWMAPEMLRGDEYDEKVDVFSFGIVTCEMIGRVKADPDELPRQNNFGLDEPGFRLLSNGCPPPFYNMAVKCTSLISDSRPSFQTIEHQLGLLLQLVNKQIDITTLPEDFYHFSNF